LIFLSLLLTLSALLGSLLHTSEATAEGIGANYTLIFLLNYIVFAIAIEL